MRWRARARALTFIIWKKHIVECSTSERETNERMCVFTSVQSERVHFSFTCAYRFWQRWINCRPNHAAFLSRKLCVQFIQRKKNAFSSTKKNIRKKNQPKLKIVCISKLSQIRSYTVYLKAKWFSVCSATDFFFTSLFTHLKPDSMWFCFVESVAIWTK